MKGIPMGMNYQFSEDEERFQHSVRSYFSETYPPDRTRQIEAGSRRFNSSLYRQLGDRGWLGLLAGADKDGSSWTKSVLFHREVGRHLVPGPLFGSDAVCTPLVARLLPAAHRDALLPNLLGGSIIAALARTGDEANSTGETTRLVPVGNGFRLSGKKALVEYGESAKTLLVTADTDGVPALAVVDADADGIAMRHYPSLDGGQRSAISFENVSLSADEVVALDPTAQRVFEDHLDRVRLLRAADLIGVGEAALELALKYAQDRVQYGRPIGSFQAIQHKAADMAIQLEVATWLVYYAGWCLDNDEGTAESVPMALHRTGSAIRYVTSEAITIHGGVGVMEPYEVGRFYRRAKAFQTALGETDDILERIAAQI